MEERLSDLIDEIAAALTEEVRGRAELAEMVSIAPSAALKPCSYSCSKSSSFSCGTYSCTKLFDCGTGHPFSCDEFGQGLERYVAWSDLSRLLERRAE